jgi:hypothetical protein
VRRDSTLQSTGDTWPEKSVRWLLESVDVIDQLADELGRVVSEAEDERPIQAFFERNPELLVKLVRGGHGRWVFPKPRFGSEHIPDFMICERDSGGYHWHLVELENPNHRALTKNGQPTAYLTQARQQIDDWRIWLRKNVQYAQTELGYLGLDDEFHSIIVIGRREAIGTNQQDRYRELAQGKVEVMSYDRLLERVVSLAKGWRQLWDTRLTRGGEADSTELKE